MDENYINSEDFLNGVSQFLLKYLFFPYSNCTTDFITESFDTSDYARNNSFSRFSKFFEKLTFFTTISFARVLNE